MTRCNAAVVMALVVLVAVSSSPVVSADRHQHEATPASPPLPGPSRSAPSFLPRSPRDATPRSPESGHRDVHPGPSPNSLSRLLVTRLWKIATGSARRLLKMRTLPDLFGEWNITTSPECRVPRQPGPCDLANEEHIHVAIISADWDRDPFVLNETMRLVKSVIAQTRCKLWIHFLIQGEPEVLVLTAQMELARALAVNPVPWSPALVADQSNGTTWGYGISETDPGLTSAPVVYSMHQIPSDWVVEEVKKLQLNLNHHEGVPGISKMFLPQLLWQEERVLYLDSDTILGGDIRDLWEYARAMDAEPELLYWMANNFQKHWQPFCAGVMVMHLGHMRRREHLKMFVDSLEGKEPHRIAMLGGDQGFFTWLCLQSEKICRVLPHVWSVNHCSQRWGKFLGMDWLSREAHGSCWRVVHFNCMGHSKNGEGKAYQVPRRWRKVTDWLDSLDISVVVTGRSPEKKGT